MEPIYTKCDNSCGQSFHVKHLKTDKLHNNIEKTYFNCLNCGCEYVCFYTDDQIRQLQNEQQNIKKKLKRKRINIFEKNGLMFKLDKLNKEVKKCMSSLKQEVEQREPKTFTSL